jgi:hypothetical protein
VNLSHIRAVALCKQAAMLGHVGASEWLFRNGYKAWVESSVKGEGIREGPVAQQEQE